MALASNLEALEAYHKYSQDGNQALWQQLIQNTEQSVQVLQQRLPQALQQGGPSRATQSQSSMGSSSGMGSQDQPGRGYQDTQRS